jgi:hypothetical protein
MLRTRFKQSVYAIQHCATGFCLLLTAPSDDGSAHPDTTLTPPGLATHFSSRSEAEHAFAQLGVALCEIVRFDA